MIATALEYEVVADPITADEFRVEAIDYEEDGEVYVTIFSGPESKSRAEEYARWKNSISR
jgi:hypothetical protein